MPFPARCNRGEEYMPKSFYTVARHGSSLRPHPARSHVGLLYARNPSVTLNDHRKKMYYLKCPFIDAVKFGHSRVCGKDLCKSDKTASE